MAFDINEFISIKPIIDQLNQNPNSKIKISKSQARILSNMPEDKFNSFLDLMKKPFGQPNPPTNSSIFIKNIQAIQSTRDQRLAARINNPAFIKAAEIKKGKEIISNTLNSEKNAINFLKQEGKPLNFLTKEINSGKKMSSLGFKYGEKGLPPIFKNKKNVMPPMIEGMEKIQPYSLKPEFKNIGAEKRMESFRRAQQARLSTQGSKNIPIQQAGSVKPPPRASSRVAEMLGEDTVRAASVIHSSKMNYATVGLAGMAAVFGIASASRQRTNIEQEIQNR